MKHLRLLLVLITGLLFSFHSRRVLTTDSSKGKWVTLFNGKDLKGWTPKIAGYKLGENFGNTFRVENGILSTRYNEYDSFNNRFGALYYNKQFTNYRLRVEYRFTGNLTPGAPSWGFRDGGIQYHCQPPSTVGLDQPFPVCLEFNLQGGNGHEERPNGQICCSGMFVFIDGKRNTEYCTMPTIKKTMTGDDWVTAEVDVHDGKIAHYLNGEKVIEFENPHYDSAHAIGKTFILNGQDVVIDGYISLQSNSHPMDFRKIEIMEY